MSIHQSIAHLAQSHQVSQFPVAREAQRTFDLHPALFAATLAGYLAYLGVMAASFMTKELAIPFAIFAITIVAAFAVPGMWARIEGPRIGRLPNWREFLERGIVTGSGHLSGRSAAVQVLIMPVMLLGWGLCIAIIHAAV